MASRKPPKNKLQGAELREFRRKVSQLKKLGGVSKTVKAGSQKPTRYMVRKVAKLEPVLSGQATLIPKRALRSDILKDYERTHQTSGRNVLIPKQGPSETVRVREGLPEVSRSLGQGSRGRVIERRIPLPIDLENIDDFIADLRNNPQKWARERGPYPPWVFGFTIYGNRSHLFVDPEILADWLERYLTVEDPGEAWENFILYAIDSEAGPWANPKGTSHNYKRGGRRRGEAQTPAFRKLLRVDQQRQRRATMTSAKAEEIRRKDKERHARNRRDPSYAKAELERERARKAAVRRALGMKERKPKRD